MLKFSNERKWAWIFFFFFWDFLITIPISLIVTDYSDYLFHYGWVLVVCGFEELVYFFQVVTFMRVKLFTVFSAYPLNGCTICCDTFFLFFFPDTDNLCLLLLNLSVLLEVYQLYWFFFFLLKNRLCFIFLFSILLLSAFIFTISFGIYSYINLPAVLYPFPLQFLFFTFYISLHYSIKYMLIL